MPGAWLMVGVCTAMVAMAFGAIGTVAVFLEPLAAVEDPALGHVAALGAQQVGDRLERGRLPGAVRAEQRDDLAFLHLQRHALQHEDHVVVDHLDAVHRQHGSAWKNRPAWRPTRAGFGLTTDSLWRSRAW